jgi:hypothetical protein
MARGGSAVWIQKIISLRLKPWQGGHLDEFLCCLDWLKKIDPINKV